MNASGDSGVLQDAAHFLQCLNIGEVCTQGILTLVNNKATTVVDFFENLLSHSDMENK